MAKFNTGTARPAGRGPMSSRSTPDTRTYEGAPGHSRDDKSALFLLAVSNFVGENTFYEDADTRDARYRDLVGKVARTDPIWLYNMLVWLRENGNMRSASTVGAAEFVRAWQGDSGAPVIPVDPSTTSATRGVLRAVIDEVCRRADEPGELLAYWTSRYGKNVPKPIKRGLGDACTRLYTEYSALKYDTDTRGGGQGFRFADVIELCHAIPNGPKQSALYRYLLDKRHDRNDALLTDGSGLLTMTLANRSARRTLAEVTSASELPAIDFRSAGLTWEDVLSLLGSRVDKARLWEQLIRDGAMGYMALLRNLRNFEQAGIDRMAVRAVCNRLADPEQVARSRQLPFRFFSAYRNTNSLNWASALEDALNLSLRNVPELPGRTLVLVDTSASMRSTVSANSTVSCVDTATLFGSALAQRNVGRVDLCGFATGSFRFNELARGGSVLRTIEGMSRKIGSVGHGTDVTMALRTHYTGHDRVVVISDEQTMGHSRIWGQRDGSVSSAVPANVPMYAFNLGGYGSGMMGTGDGNPNRHQLGGLTDATFKMIPLIEAGRVARWPWEQPE